MFGGNKVCHHFCLRRGDNVRNKKLWVAGVIIILLASSYFWSGDDKDSLPTAENTLTETVTSVITTETTESTTETVTESVTQYEVSTEIITIAEVTAESTSMMVVTVNGVQEEPDKRSVCTISVVCNTILDNMDNLTEGKEVLVPEDGIIYGAAAVEFEEGESVFDVLLREMKNNNIHMEYSATPAYNSTYIEGINNLYEFDCGALSGWMYKVNGVYPSYGSSKYILQDGDVIEWIYTCDLGRDIGGGEVGVQR